LEKVKCNVFVIMPFEDCFFEVYEMLKLEFFENFEFSHAGVEDNQQNILKDIIQPIYEADVILADLTGLNPNVLYELGIAHTFNKKTITITQGELSDLPFDLKQYRATHYTTHFKDFAKLVEYLRKNLSGAMDGSVSFSNPVKDFISLEKIESPNWFAESLAESFDDSDKGFFDFLEELENDTNEMSDELAETNDKLSVMNNELNALNDEFSQANDNGGPTAAVVVIYTNKVAKVMTQYTNDLKVKNTKIIEYWDRIEKNTLGLLENKFAGESENKSALIDYLKSLKEMQGAASSTHASFEGLKTALSGISGLGRSLNHAIKFMRDELDNSLGFFLRIDSSVDQIIAKSKFVVGEIELEQRSTN